MRFIRSRFGIVLWCAIALIILAVPLWRLRVTRQWKFVSVQEALPNYSLSPIPYGFTADDEAAARKRFPDEPVAQLARLNTGDLWREISVIIGPALQSSGAQKDLLEQQKAQLKKLNPRIWKLTDAYFTHYDNLLRRFPKSKLVRAQYLRDVLSVTNIADEGPLSEKDEDAEHDQSSLALKSNSPASPATLDKAIALARETALLYPDNAYFRWAEAVCQFAQKRPDKALIALEAAGRCAKFDDYTYEGMQERVELLQKLRVVGWEDYLSEWVGFLFPQYPKMRSATRAATGQMRLARRRGDEKTALRWSAATARAAYPVVRNERDSVVGKLVGQALCNITWSAAIENESNVPEYKQVPGDNQEQYIARSARYQKLNAERFALYARAHGDEALARQTLALLPALDAGTIGNYAIQSETLDFNRLSDFYWLGAQLLRLSLVGALVWLLSSFVTRKRSAQVAAMRTKMLLPAMFCAGATVAILIAALTVAPQIHGIFDSFMGATSDEKPSLLVTALRNWWWFVGALWLSVSLVNAMRDGVAERTEGASSERAGKTKWLATARTLLIVGFVIGSAGVCIAVETRVPIDSILGQLFLILMVLWWGCAFVGSVSMLLLLRGQARVLALCCVIAFWAGVTALPSPTYGGDELFYKPIVAAAAIIAAVIGLFMALRIWVFGSSRPRMSVPAFPFAASIRIGAGVLALLCAVAYFGITLWTIPIEAQASSMMQRQLQIGEVAWLREQIAAQK